MRLAGRPPVFVGVVHLLPLPGEARAGPGIEAVVQRAVADARALAAGGVDAAIVENLGDAPFARSRVPAATVAAMTRAACEIRRAVPELPLGINVLRNDARASLGIASVVGAAFIRVNVHVGAMLTDQGLIEGDARRTLAERRRLGCEVALAADVLVKHATPLGAPDLAQVARDTAHRGCADVLIVSGSGTGAPTDAGELAEVRRAVPGTPVWVGSGLVPDTARTLDADGAIVGTWLHGGGDLQAPVDADRVREIRRALDR